ncbi:hypothetical protein GJ744_009649 [Endocarpon pusillum]|uniref:Uncharacterized protein n=1 Tax=Endocarpon pusillum TaxID=364733 RepID=A0A8H7AHQ2_9EURO|nr:hypothetical protein GJ744_009649 [Endocarpon pusillum]
MKGVHVETLAKLAMFHVVWAQHGVFSSFIFHILIQCLGKFHIPPTHEAELLGLKAAALKGALVDCIFELYHLKFQERFRPNGFK